uniref:Uncharacterized protein n=1 Tax=Moniliophthora roreri TaxID=221103 RepID=A0A0W0FAH5_MONRR
MSPRGVVPGEANSESPPARSTAMRGPPLPIVTGTSSIDPNDQSHTRDFKDPSIIARIGYSCPERLRPVSPDPVLLICPSFDYDGSTGPLTEYVRQSKEYASSVQQWTCDLEAIVQEIQAKERRRKQREKRNIEIEQWKLLYRTKENEIRLKRLERLNQASSRRDTDPVPAAGSSMDAEPPQKRQKTGNMNEATAAQGKTSFNQSVLPLNMSVPGLSCEQCLQSGRTCTKSNSTSVTRCIPCTVKKKGCSFCGTSLKQTKSTTSSTNKARTRKPGGGHTEVDLHGRFLELTGEVRRLKEQLSNMQKEWN